ncbi:type II toxin-antitoxin system RelB/DinJ family antitoxin [Enterococcus nangangensis]
MAVVHIEIDHQLKQEASEVLAELGMNLSMGIEIFLKEVVNKKELPFQLNISELELSILEIKHGMATKVDSVDALLENLNDNL